MSLKNKIIIGVGVFLLLILIICGYRAYINSEVTLNLEQWRSKKILITYFSKTGDVSTLGNTIQGIVGGDMIKIEPERLYPGDKNAYHQRLKQEKDDNSLVPLKSTTPNLKQYDIIFIGTPSVLNIDSPVIKSYLLKNNKFLKKKIVIPFITYEINGQAMSAYRDISFQTPYSYIKNPYIVKEGDKSIHTNSMTRWLTLMRFRRYELR